MKGPIFGNWGSGRRAGKNISFSGQPPKGRLAYMRKTQYTARSAGEKYDLSGSHMRGKTSIGETTGTPREAHGNKNVFLLSTLFLRIYIRIYIFETWAKEG